MMKYKTTKNNAINSVKIKNIKESKNGYYSYTKDFIKICKMSSEELYNFMLQELKKHYKRVYKSSKKTWLYAPSEKENIILTAHIDTVHTQRIKTVKEYKYKNNTYITSDAGIGGDDRCGVYMILQLLENGYKPGIILCDKEESGGIGSSDFIKTINAKKNKKIKDRLKKTQFMIELDRMNSSDAVYYSCDNRDFIDYIEDEIGYKEAFGSFSDIENMMKPLGVAGVNLSCGYYNQHTTEEYVIFEEMMKTIEAVEKLLHSDKSFEYIEYKYSDAWFDYYYDDKYSRYSDYYSNYYSDYYSDKENNFIELEIMYKSEKHNKYYSELITGISESEAIGKFLIDHPELRYCDIEIIDYQRY